MYTMDAYWFRSINSSMRAICMNADYVERLSGIVLYINDIYDFHKNSDDINLTFICSLFYVTLPMAGLQKLSIDSLSVPLHGNL